MSKTKSLINKEVFKNDRNAIEIAIHLVMSYKYAIGMETQVLRPLAESVMENCLNDEHMNSIALKARSMISHDWDETPWTDEQLEKFLPDLVQLLKHIVKEGENLFPDIALIADIADDDECLFDELVFYWKCIRGDEKSSINISNAYNIMARFHYDKNDIEVWEKLYQQYDDIDKVVHEYFIYLETQQ